jgi:integrase/recombinase XerD
MGRHLTLVPLSERLRVVLSQGEVAQLLEAAPGVKYKAAFSVAYGAGLRVSEVANLKVSDIDSKRMLLRIEQGKGRRDRHAMLSPKLLVLLRDYWWVAKPSTWLFPGRDPLLPITTRQLHRVVCETAEAIEINKRVTPHVLRHYSESRIMPSRLWIAVATGTLSLPSHQTARSCQAQRPAASVYEGARDDKWHPDQVSRLVSS